jgi:hypothetical protein
LQPRAVIIVRIGAACRFECGDRAVTIAEPIADGAERKPRRGKTRCDLDGLRQQIGCSNKVAPPGKFDGCLVTAIADKVAGGYKQWAGVGHLGMIPKSGYQFPACAKLRQTFVLPFDAWAGEGRSEKITLKQ